MTAKNEIEPSSQLKQNTHADNDQPDLQAESASLAILRKSKC
jgi:hypothetical protein